MSKSLVTPEVKASPRLVRELGKKNCADTRLLLAMTFRHCEVSFQISCESFALMHWLAVWHQKDFREKQKGKKRQKDL